MNFIKKINNPNYNFSWRERKILQALWVKNAPMTYQQLLGVCVTEMWPEDLAPELLDSLQKKEVIIRLKDGSYDAVLDKSDYEKYLKRRKLSSFFYPDPPYYPPTAITGCFDLGDDPEYTARRLDKILEKRKQILQVDFKAKT